MSNYVHKDDSKIEVKFSKFSARFSKLKPGFHMIVRIVPIVPVVSKKMFRRPGRSYGNATQTIANDPGDSKFTRSPRSSG